MSLDVYLMKNRPVEVYESNITHNLGGMAKAVGIYYHLWRPSERGFVIASDLIEGLEAGLTKLKANPESFREYEPDNKWGQVEDLIRFTEQYLAACRKNPEAEIRVSR